jgi:hypothetical protein
MARALKAACTRTEVRTVGPLLINREAKLLSTPHHLVILEGREWTRGIDRGTPDDLMVLFLACGQSICKATREGDSSGVMAYELRVGGQETAHVPRVLG